MRTVQTSTEHSVYSYMHAFGTGRKLAAEVIKPDAVTHALSLRPWTSVYYACI